MERLISKFLGQWNDVHVMDEWILGLISYPTVLVYEICQVIWLVLCSMVLTYLSFLKYRFDGFQSLSMCSR